MKKIVVLTIILSLLLTLSGGLTMAYELPQQATEFNLQFYEHGNGTVDLEILTDKTKGVGGIQILVSVNRNLWRIDEGGTAGFIENSAIKVQDSTVRFIWGSTEAVTLPDKLLRIKLHSNQENYDLATIQVSVEDYYDDTINMNGLSYTYISTLIHGKAKPLYNVWLIILNMLLVLTGVFALFAVSRKWRYIVVTRLNPIVKKIHKKIKVIFRKTAS